VAFVVVMWGGGLAHAHKLKVFATAEGRMIHGSAYFRVGAPAKGAKVEVFGPAGRRLAEAVTDGKGEFTVEAKVRGDHRIVVVSGDGHRAEYTLEAEELPDDLPGAAGGPEAAAERPGPAVAAPGPGQGGPPPAELERMIERAVSKQVNPLREQLARFEEKRTLLDLVGGIGYIVGIVGVAFYFLGTARRRRAASSSD
jgi:nickel transport protein